MRIAGTHDRATSGQYEGTRKEAENEKINDRFKRAVLFQRHRICPDEPRQGGGMRGGGWWWNMGYGGGVGILLVIGIVVGVVYMVKRK